MEKLLVPIIINNSINSIETKLYTITGKIFENHTESIFCGEDYPELDKKLFSYFNNSFDFTICEIDKDLKNGCFDNFTENTLSISLGVFVTAYALINNRKLKDKYGSITITGDFKCENNRIKLSNVIFIKEKYSAVIKYVSNLIDTQKKNLFIYVADEEIIPEGIDENNILILRFTEESSIEEIFAEIFEPEFKLEQKDSFKEFCQNYTNEYVQTKNFIKWKKELIREDCGGFIIGGESNTGKSITARALCEYLLETNTIDSSVWISVNDNENFLEILRIDNKSELGFNSNNSLLKETYSKQFSVLDTGLKNGKKITLVIDNIEYDYVDELLIFLAEKYSHFHKNIKILITSWHKAHNISKIQELNLTNKNILDISLSKTEFDSIASSIANHSNYMTKFQQSDLKSELLDILYSQIPNNPGYIPIALSSLSFFSVKDLIKKYNNENIKNLNPKNRILKIAFSTLNIFSQMVLFASLSFKTSTDKSDGEISRLFNKDKICEILQKKLIKKHYEDKMFFSPHNVERALLELQESNTISILNNSYSLKNDIIQYFIFSESGKNEITRELENLRNALIGIYSKIRWAIKLHSYKDFEKFIGQVTDLEKKNEFFKECCKNDCDIRFIKKFIECGVDINLGVNKPDTSPAVWLTTLYSSHLENLQYLIEKGARISEKDKEGIAISVCLNSNSKMFEYVFEHKMYKNINNKFTNELAHLDGHTFLHLVAVANSDLKILKNLLSLGADYNIRSNDNNTILHFAAINKKTTDILEYILDNSLFDDFYAKNNEGLTALDLARKRNYQKAIDLLETYETNHL